MAFNGILDDFSMFGKSKKTTTSGIPDETYEEKIKRLEKEYLLAQNKAEQEYRNNQNKHTKQECLYLKEAQQKCQELASITQGAEREHRLKQVKFIETNLTKIVRELDADTADRIEKLKEDSKKKNTQTNSTKSNNQVPKAAQISDEEVAGWFKEIPKHSFEDVSGMDELKETLKKCVSDTHMELRQYLKKKTVRSYIFIGPSGCGKTYIVEAFAHELIKEQNYKYMSLKSGDILSPLVGVAEQKVGRLFKEIEANAPCLVFIDEIDGVCKNRKLSNLPEYSKTLTTAFLTGYNDICNSDKEIIFIAATNFPNQVDDAMVDRIRVIRVPLPDMKARISAFEKGLKDLISIGEDLTLEEIGQATKDYSYRDIDRFIELLKDEIEILAEKKQISDSEMVHKLQNKEICIDKEMFNDLLKKNVATPKDKILSELDEWENRFKKE